MQARRRVTCPECGSKLSVEDVAPGQVKVVTRERLPEECCQRAATSGSTLTGVFVVEPRK
ncbi:MAG: hypothetical protein L0214_07535 [candidate division NC10 bacterium]|nr:hypothetical protein [candidate division NC10 bacterium]